jgi:hypothetical protein
MMPYMSPKHTVEFKSMAHLLPNLSETDFPSSAGYHTVKVYTRTTFNLDEFLALQVDESAARRELDRIIKSGEEDVTA